MLCRSCGENIRFVKTAGGKTMPINAKPDPEGTLVLIGTEFGEDVTVHHVGRPEPQLELMANPRYKSHFATCPDRHVWRKSRY